MHGMMDKRYGFFIQYAIAFGELTLEYSRGFLLQAALGAEAFNAGDVAHSGFSFDGFDILPVFLLQSIRQAHHPIQYDKQVGYPLPLPALGVESSNQGALGAV